MSDIVISVENLSKQYRLGMVGAGTLREDLVGLWYKLRGHEDPYVNAGETNDRSAKGKSDFVWALKDVNFEVNKGEVLGIIGKNGAGKSTLLKLLSRVTSPTKGFIKAKGRIASLLEVGTGFHPELTGRENIYLNGAIMGMRKAEISKKLDEIIDFAGVERYVDTPVKRYSSGMYVRLAFAVAAHLEPEILIVDEVLAVGDAEFQKKAIGKMQDVSTGEGRTVLFVSHNMKAVSNLCDRAVLLKNGKIDFEGAVRDTIENYLNINQIADKFLYHGSKSDSGHGIKLDEIRVIGKSPFKSSSEVLIELTCTGLFKNPEVHINFHLKTQEDIHLFQCSSDVFPLNQGETVSVQFKVPMSLLNEGKYKVGVNFVKNRSRTIHSLEDVVSFTVAEDYDLTNLAWYEKPPGLLLGHFETKLIKR